MTLDEALAWRGGGIPAEYLVPGAMVVVVESHNHQAIGSERLATVTAVGPGYVVVDQTKFIRRKLGDYTQQGTKVYLALPRPERVERIQRKQQRRALSRIVWIHDPMYRQAATDAQIEAMHATAVAFGLLPALEQS